jgi:hypothetical protein
MRIRTLLLSSLVSLSALAATTPAPTRERAPQGEHQKHVTYKGQKQVNKALWEKSQHAARSKYLRAKAVADQKVVAVTRAEKKSYAIVDVEWEKKEREALRASSMAKAQWQVNKNSHTKAARKQAKAEYERVLAQGRAERQIARAHADAAKAKANATAMYEKSVALAQADVERANADAARRKANAQARMETR